MNEIATELSRYRFDIVALQELRWKDAGVIVKKDYTLYYSGIPKKTGQKNTGFWINRNIKDKILGFEPINERICKFRVKGKFNNLSLICVYAPTEANEEVEIDIFYGTLENVCDRVKKYDTLIILGDFNARIWKEGFVNSVAGRLSLHDEISSNGLKLCQWAGKSSLKIISTDFQHKDIHKGTWQISKKETANQIDHVLMNTRRRFSVTDLKACRGANCDSDHYLVKVKIRQKIFSATKTKGDRQIKWNIEKLKIE